MVLQSKAAWASNTHPQSFQMTEGKRNDSVYRQNWGGWLAKEKVKLDQHFNLYLYQDKLGMEQIFKSKTWNHKTLKYG